jgi:RNA polymerase sigma-70 factor (ECF subfamily)
MSNDDSTQLHQLLEQLHQGGDLAEQALIDHTFKRLRFLVRKILHQEFPRLEGVHKSASIPNETALPLLKSLRDAQPKNPLEFFGFAGLQIRRILLELARRHDEHTGLPNRAPLPDALDLHDPSSDPVGLAICSEFHENVDRLPPQEREVVHWRAFGIAQKEVSRIWQRALMHLSDFWKDNHGLHG